MANARIVVADDDPETRDTVQALLEARGYTARTAADRDGGMAIIRRELPDLVILDVMMETWQDGFEMSGEIKKDPELKGIPILMLTAVGQRTGIDIKSTAGDSKELATCDGPPDYTYEAAYDEACALLKEHAK